MTTKPRPFAAPRKRRTSAIGKPPGFQKRGEKGTPLVFQLRFTDLLVEARFREEITDTEFRVVYFLVRQSRPVEGYADPEQDVIARAARCSRRQVNYALDALEAKGWIRRETIKRPTRYYPLWLRALFPGEHDQLFGPEPSNVVPLIGRQ